MKSTDEKLRDVIRDMRDVSMYDGNVYLIDFANRLEAIDSQPVREGVTDADREKAYQAALAVSGESRPWMSREIINTALAVALGEKP
jgi:hypothetical protein